MIEIIPNFHPVVVHFPIALTLTAFLLALLCSLLKYHRLANYWSAASHLALWAAALSAVVAVIFGGLAYNSVNHDDAGHVAMLVHRVWAVSTTLFIVVLALWDVKKHKLTTILPFYFLLLLGFASASVGVTAWLGGEVVYRHGIGVLALPAPEMEGSGYEHGAHEHGAEHEHSADNHGAAKSSASIQGEVAKSLNHDAMNMDMPAKSAPAAVEENKVPAAPATHDANDGHQHQHKPSP